MEAGVTKSTEVEVHVFEYLMVLIFPAAMILGGVLDLFTLTIPNRISLALIIGFFVAALVTGMSWAAIGLHLAIGMAVLLLGIALFATGSIGGGDAKLLAAAALWLGHDQILSYVLMVTVAGGLLSILVLSYRSMILPPVLIRQPWALRLHDRSTGIPYGLALAAAALWIYPRTSWFHALAS